MLASRQPATDGRDASRLLADRQTCDAIDGSPARGIAIGLLISVTGFWVPVIGVLGYWLTRS